MPNFIKRWRALWNPNMYHGWGKERSYFEGWYFKIVDPSENYAFAIIPGISKDKVGKQHAFIQVLDGKACTASYHEYDAAQFKASVTDFQIQLEEQQFSGTAISLNLKELKGQLRFINPYPWPKMLGAPGIMGWYSFVPFMECYHGVVSMHHQLKGKLEVYGKVVDFTGGLGYTEKDWGTSFPNAWIWMQSNHFDNNQQVSLMASVANIPWLSSHFIGYIVGFLIEGKLYKFATYTGAMMRAILLDHQVHLSFKDRTYRLEIIAHKGPGGELVSPLSGKMTGKVNESMQARLEVQLYQKEQLIFEGSGKNAGLEVAGVAETLLTKQWRR